MESVAEKFGFWMFIVLITLICIFGILGNILSLLVLAAKRMRSSTSIILVGLVISDVMILFCGLVINSIGMIVIRIYFESKDIPRAAVIVFRIFHPLKKIGNLASVYITVLVTVERYIAVCWPFHAKTVLTVRASLFWTYGIMTGSLIYNFPRFFESWEVQLGNSSVLESTSSTNKSSSYLQYSHGWGKTTVHYIIPFLVLVVLNAQIYHRILVRNRDMNKWTMNGSTRSMSSKRLQLENALTKMLLCIVMVFLLCNTGQGICDWIFIYSSKGASSVIADGISALLLMFNSAVNFIIYCTMGTKFRNHLIEILPVWCLCGRKNELVVKESVSSVSAAKQQSTGNTT